MADVFIIAIDGPDAAGKTALIHELSRYFNESTSFHCKVFSPNQTACGGVAKRLLDVNHRDDDLNKTLHCFGENELSDDEALNVFHKLSLYETYHEIKSFMEKIKDENGRWIIVIDRWLLTHQVYQGYVPSHLTGKSVPWDTFVIRLIDKDFINLQVILDAKDSVLDERILSRRGLDKYENSTVLQKAIRNGFRTHMTDAVKNLRVVRVDTSRSIDESFRELLSEIIFQLNQIDNSGSTLEETEDEEDR